MITKQNFFKGVIIILYGYLLTLFLLLYRQELNNFFSTDYILMRNVKIDCFYNVSHSGNRNGDSHYINFKDSGKKITLLLEENTLTQKRLVTQLFNNNFKTYNLVKREKNKSFFSQNTVYFTFDDRFICNATGECNFTETYKNKVLNYLIFGILVIIGITYCTYRVYNSKIIKSLKSEKFKFNFLNSFKD